MLIQFNHVLTKTNNAITVEKDQGLTKRTHQLLMFMFCKVGATSDFFPHSFIFFFFFLRSCVAVGSNVSIHDETADLV